MKHQSKNIKVVLPSLWLSFFFVGTPVNAAEVGDKLVVGVWEARETKKSIDYKKRWVIEADGNYTMTNEPLKGGDSFGVSGSASFEKGTWSMSPQSKGAVKEEGTYSLSPANRLTIRSTSGDEEWERVTNLMSGQEARKHNNKGVIFGKQGNWADAINEHVIATAAEPTNTSFRQNLSAAHLQYANLLLTKGDRIQAEKHYRQALDADCNNRDASDGIDKCKKK